MAYDEQIQKIIDKMIEDLSGQIEQLTEVIEKASNTRQALMVQMNELGGMKLVLKMLAKGAK